MLVTSKKLFQIAKEKHFAIPSANFVDMDSLKWHLETAEELNLPIIISLAESHLDRLITIEDAATMAKIWGEQAKVPVVLHLDHGQSFEMCKKAIDLGFTSVMIDGSMKPFEENVAITKKVIEYAHDKGVVVEAEIGHVGSNEVESDNDIYTTVEEATKFVEQTGVDSLAVSIGTAHGLYKGTPKINFDRLHELAAAVSAPLVLHGGSSSGDENLHRCATEGIAKINVYSDFMVASAKSVYALAPKEAEVEDYYTYKTAAKKGMQDMLKHVYELFATQSVTL
ncbi:class II fructose-bisphosphate aldolase [Catenisphaera adipataccumulans]|uniref:Fructose-bisphosphate aldolase class II n=1 Tax=Catenisphaera adipataccumulans TaxID=700500 RepID=A0A7W8FWA2_9FIRM|nr:class II fructose-bisphosphate aldolase [Catenisphaera adipataccumulans]MBB5183041.1 fructose-bisphosphate aldolase class II [Catenisphaera adipataccumulans]